MFLHDPWVVCDVWHTFWAIRLGGCLACNF